MGRGLLLLGATVFAISGCANATPEQKHEAGCVAGTLTGAVLGGLLGSTIGAGTGNVLATTAGAGLGTVAGERLTCG